ncbi:MFS transporter [Micromonospora zhanjiangensis]
MNLKPYRQALALPGVRSLLLVAMLARVPLTACGVVLTLYVVQDLRHGYAAAGLAGAAMTVGMAVGAPLLGRLVDRRGLRPMLLLTASAQAVFWLSAQALPYPALVVAAFLGGLLELPLFSVVRQSIAALVPESRRRQAYALDSMSVELSFMVGPALGVLLATTWSTRGTMVLLGAAIVLSGLALFALNPPTRAAHEAARGAPAVPRRQWLTGRLLGLLAVSAGTTLVLGGTDVSVVAALRHAGQVEWTGAVLGIWAAASLVGGFAYGAVRRPPTALRLALLLCLGTLPVGLSGDRWWLLALFLLPAGVLCAPTLASTADAVSRLAPAAVRGEAMGLHGSAVTVGIALGAPLAGAVIDASAPAWGFAATGAVGALVVLAALITGRHRHRPARDASTAPDQVVVDAIR